MTEPPRYRTFTEEELAFFWDPRNWLEIRSRFHDKRFGGDVRDAVIHLDDEGGLGFLTWSAEAGTWALTHRGKTWCRSMLQPGRIAAARAWHAPEEDIKRLKEEDAVRRESLAREKRGKKRPRPSAAEEFAEEGPEAIEIAVPAPEEVPDAVVEDQAAELARLMAEQAEDL